MRTRIARRAGLGHGYIYGMLRDAGENPKPANWRRPSKPADLATAPGRNCALFAALCKLALGGSDEGLLTWARTLNSEFAVPLPESGYRHDSCRNTR